MRSFQLTGQDRARNLLNAHRKRSRKLAGVPVAGSGFEYFPSRDGQGRSLIARSKYRSGRFATGNRGNGKAVRRAEIKARREAKR